MIEYRVGDLFEYERKPIAHGCNTRGLMGAGIAKIVADRYGSVYVDYATACSPHNKSTSRFVPGDAQLCYAAPDRIVFNLATQDHPGAHAAYHWVERSFARMFELMYVIEEREVAIPRIGCGIGGLKWHGVEEMIKRAQATAPGSPSVVVYTHTSEKDKQW
jgi:O-acetyl-ADP-ribose deacetylase (regulator of RNase III)